MKFTLCITQRCTLSCSYCYIGKRDAVMSTPIARKIIDWIFAKTPKEERIEIGFFGGEPLLEFQTIREITHMIEDHADFEPTRVTLTVVSNGTIWSPAIADFLNSHRIAFCLSCDGPPDVHDRFRRFPNGGGSSKVVERTAKEALEVFGPVPVNAVYRPETFRELPAVVDYFSSLGFRQIYLSPDFSAPWSKAEANCLPEIYGQVASQYLAWYLQGKPHFISLIDSKIAVLLRGGYLPAERCHMGTGEFAFTPEGNIYPCERLIGNGVGGPHCLGNIGEGLADQRHASDSDAGLVADTQCADCGLREYCMNWCGCSNYFSTGDHRRVGPFLCASERVSIELAASVFESLEQRVGPTFLNHLAGLPSHNSIRSS